VSPASRVVTGAAAGLLALTVAGHGGAWHWLLDLTSHFRWYWLLAAAIGLVATLRRPLPLARACFGLAAAVNAWAMLPFWMPAVPAGAATEQAAVAAPDRGVPLALVTVNVRRRNHDTARCVAYLRDRRPDVAVVIEPDAVWQAALESLADLYPHRAFRNQGDNFGIGVLSRWPLRDPEFVTLGGTPYPNLITRVVHDGGELLLVATHPHAPMTATHSHGLRSQLNAVAARAAAATGPCVVAGDFNATPWSVAYREFVATSGLVDTALGRGLEPTWNARLPAPRIPIDHVFVSQDVRVTRRAVGPDIGSDHFPVEVDLVLPRRGE
jgi:endonuclease/exonuclease/phosphatase (EEP) superfamily protein YafD